MHVRYLVILRLSVESTDLLNNSMILVCQGIYLFLIFFFLIGQPIYTLVSTKLDETLKYQYYLLFGDKNMDE